MNVSVNKIDTLRRELRFEIPADRFSRKREEILAGFVRRASIPGFRPGKAPRALVEKAHGASIKEETLQRLLPEVYHEGIRKEALDPIDFPAIDQVDLKEDGALTFRAVLDLRPAVEIDGYRGVSLKRRAVSVSEDDVNKALEFFRKGRGADAPAEVPADDALAKSVGFNTLEEFRQALRRNLEHDRARQNLAETEAELVEILLSRADLPAVPQGMVDRQLEVRLEDTVRRLQAYGVKEDLIAKKLEEGRAAARAAAEKDVRLFLILHRIAQKENIEVQEKEPLSVKVMDFLFKEAKWEEAS